MTGTAIGVNSWRGSTRTITFKSEAHKEFYMEYLPRSADGPGRVPRRHWYIVSELTVRHTRTRGQNL